MKKIITLFLFAVFACSSVSFAQTKPQRGTAAYYLAEPERHLDKPVTIYILMAKKISAPAPEGYVSFGAHSSSNNGQLEGGSIIIYVRENKAEKFAEKHKTGWLRNGKPVVTAIPGRFIQAVGGDGYAVRAN